MLSRKFYKGIVSLVTLILLVSLLAGCGGKSSSTGKGGLDVETDEKAPVTVWIDAARKPAMDKYLETHPDQKNMVNYEVVDRGQFAAKVLLFNNTGSGWPDVVFAEPNIVMYVADKAHDYPLDLTPWVDKKIVDQFVPGSLDPCYSTDGKLLCLRNDLAPLILWYNKPLMDQFGYTVPTTWEEFMALSDKVAAEHPGYVMGSAGSPEVHFFWPSGCPIAHPLSIAKVVINTSDPKCVRVAQLMDHMLQNGTLSKYGQFDPKYIELANDNKILVQEDAAWMGDFVFGGKPDSSYYHTAEHQLAAALPLKWADEDKAYTGAWGGSAWMVSRHTKNPKLAVEVAVYMTTDIEVALLVGTMPAYGPAADAWKANMDNNPLYAFNPYDIMKQAAGLVNPNYTDAVRYSVGDGLKPLNTAVEEGNPVEPTLPDCQTELKSLAEKEGYEVVTSP
jgi:ABC-type glycerol-3-phosphate transport system substrate-binding protein